MNTPTRMSKLTHVCIILNPCLFLLSFYWETTHTGNNMIGPHLLSDSTDRFLHTQMGENIFQSSYIALKSSSVMRKQLCMHAGSNTFRPHLLSSNTDRNVYTQTKLMSKFFYVLCSLVTKIMLMQATI